MTGLERNADVVTMASYAPLLANIDYVQWRPDLIWFDNDQSWGSANYEIQKLFMTNVGDRVVPSSFTGAVRPRSPSPARSGSPPGGPPPRTTTSGSPQPTARSCSATTSPTAPTGGRRSPAAAPGPSRTAPTSSPTRRRRTPWSRRATRVGATTTSTSRPPRLRRRGLPGRLRRQGHRQLLLVEPGGWNNTQGAVEKSVDGAKTTLIAKPNTIETGRTYDVKIQVRGTKVTLLLDGQVWGSFDDDSRHRAVRPGRHPRRR